MPYFIYFNVEDDGGDTSMIEIPFKSTTAITDLPKLVPAFAALLNPLIQGGLKNAGFRVEIGGSPGSWGPLPGALSDVQEKAEFVFKTASSVGNFIKRISLPAIIDSIIGTHTKQVDLTDTDVAAFVTAMEDGVDLTSAGGSGVVQPCDVHEDDLTAIQGAVEAWGKRRKR